MSRADHTAANSEGRKREWTPEISGNITISGDLNPLLAALEPAEYPRDYSVDLTIGGRAERFVHVSMRDRALAAEATLTAIRSELTTLHAYQAAHPAERGIGYACRRIERVIGE